jgi:Tol biopolymer transport system component
LERFSRSKGIDSHGTIYFTGERTESRIFSAGFDQTSGALTGLPVLMQSHSATDQGFGSWSPDGSKFASWSFNDLFARVVTKPKVIVRSIPSGPETVAIPELSFFPQHVPTWDRDSKHLLMLVGDSGGGNTRLASLDPATGKVSPASVPVPLTNINRTPDWSRDGRFLYQRSEKGDLYQIDAHSGTQKLIYKHPPEESGVRNTTVSPDGKRLAFFGATRVMKSGGEWTSTSHWWIRVLDLETGAVQNIKIPHSGGWGGSVLAWSPNGKYLVYAVGDEKVPSLWSVPSDGSAAPKAITDALGGRVLHIGFTADGRTISYSLMKRYADIWMMSNFLEGAK